MRGGLEGRRRVKRLVGDLRMYIGVISNFEKEGEYGDEIGD